MTQKEIKALFPIELNITDEDRQKAIEYGGLHKLGTVLLKRSVPEELHNSLFWGLSIGVISGVELKIVIKENVKGKLTELPIYLDNSFVGNIIKFELR